MVNIVFTNKVFRSLTLGVILILGLVSLISIAAAQEDTVPTNTLPIPQYTGPLVNLTGDRQFLSTNTLPVSQYDVDTWLYRFVATRHPIAEPLSSTDTLSVSQYTGPLVNLTGDGQPLSTNILPVSQHEIDTWEGITAFWRNWAAQQHEIDTWEGITAFWRNWAVQQRLYR
jgi:hypothetical protein